MAKVSKFAAVFAARERMDEEESTVAPAGIASPAIEPNTIVTPAIAQPPAELSHGAIVEPHAIAPPAIAPDRFTIVPNDIFDKLLPSLPVHDQAVLMRLYRLSRGHHKDTCTVGYGTLAKACNISTRQAQISVERLIGLGLIKRMNIDQSAPVRQQRGSVYKVNLPAAKLASGTKARGTIVSGAIAGRADSKERIKKEINKGEVASPNFQNCPDCSGTGFWYPNGADKGVARCTHLKLDT